MRKDGDDVLFLNELKFKKNTALNFRLPISDEDLPAARALRGDHKVSFGTDYRGKKVLAVSRPVPGTFWNVIVKIDRDELFQGLRAMELTIFSIVILLILIFGLILKYFFRKI
ncbi:MAG: hypothetical protein HC906_04030 [Bacteroidales bacterium]|nr:hypothetical protein [Bacteroidales bacterium]